MFFQLLSKEFLDTKLFPLKLKEKLINITQIEVMRPSNVMIIYN